jgi:hypothetical protein
LSAAGLRFIDTRKTGVDGRIILVEVFKIYVWRTWTECTWLRIHMTSGELF